MKLLEAIRRAFGRDSCARDCRPQLSPYIDGELDARMRARVEAHLRGCARCRGEYDEILFAARAATLIVPPPA
ncbi:MAG: zf-HC2 domain-containing protein, partial [Pyrinomonadaceae bacterium]